MLSVRWHLLATSVAVLLVLTAAEAAPIIVTYPAPRGEPASADYAVAVNGRPVFCYTSYQFHESSKQTIVGRPVSPVSFCSFDFAGEVEVRVRLLDGLREAGVDVSHATVRPLALALRPVITGDSFTFRVSRPGQLTIEPGGGLLHPLHLFANPLEHNVPGPKDPKVHYFGPGVHNVSGLQLADGETVYIAGGAIVNLKPAEPATLGSSHKVYGVDVRSRPGLFQGDYKKNITIRGRGILCGRLALAQHQRGDLLRFQGVQNLTIEGITVRESSVWSLSAVNCEGVHVDNVKVIGHYVNNDGIVIGGTSHALVENCFCHNADDALEIKVWIPQHDVVFRNCVVWTDVGGALGLCCEAGATLENVLFDNCTVLHATCAITARGAIGLDLQGAGEVHNFRFENITIEDVTGSHHPAIKVINNWDDWHMLRPTQPDNPYVQLSPPPREHPRGAVRNVLFRNIKVLRSDASDVVLMADGENSPLQGITFDNITIGGTKLTPGDPRLKTNQWVSDISVR